MDKNNRRAIPYIKEYKWKDIRNELLKVNSKLVAAIDEVSPDDSYTLFKASYPYGANIIKRSDFYLPNDSGEIVPLTDSSISNKTKELLGYNLGSNPVSVLLNHSMELFINMQNHTVAAGNLVTPGNVFGTYRTLKTTNYSYHPAFIWDMTSGARSIFMLPKISEIEKHNNLCKNLGVRASAPKILMDHWQIFKEISQCNDFAKPWSIEIVFFSKKWFEKLEDKSWRPLHYFLLKSSWDGGDFWINNFFWNLIFAIIQRDKNLKISSYISDTVKYILAVSTGALPGFAIAKDNTAAPISDIQKAYIEIYKLKEYLPIIMQPSSFNMYEELQAAVYYALQFPNALGQTSRARTSLVQDLYEVRWLMDKYSQGIAENRLNVGNTPLAEAIKRVKYEYFHDKSGTYPNIRDSAEIFEEDENFKNILTPCNNKGFPINSPFVKGCIRIARA